MNPNAITAAISTPKSTQPQVPQFGPEIGGPSMSRLDLAT
jgi:hypothetical protein